MTLKSSAQNQEGLPKTSEPDPDRMCQTYKTLNIYSGGGCKPGVCDSRGTFVDPCPERPPVPDGHLQCEQHEEAELASKRRIGPREGHAHKESDLCDFFEDITKSSYRLSGEGHNNRETTGFADYYASMTGTKRSPRMPSLNSLVEVAQKHLGKVEEYRKQAAAFDNFPNPGPIHGGASFPKLERMQRSYDNTAQLAPVNMSNTYNTNTALAPEQADARMAANLNNWSWRSAPGRMSGWIPGPSKSTLEKEYADEQENRGDVARSLARMRHLLDWFGIEAQHKVPWANSKKVKELMERLERLEGQVDDLVHGGFGECAEESAEPAPPASRASTESSRTMSASGMETNDLSFDDNF